MQLSGKKYFDLPKIKDFSFIFDNIEVSDLEKISFAFIDKNLSSFSFIFESGFIYSDKIICGYNNKEFNKVEGYIKNGDLFYKINNIYGKITGSFSELEKFNISINGNPINCDLFFYSNPINYSIVYNPQYSLSGNLTGNFYSDTNFKIKDFSLKFLNSENDLLEKDLSYGLFTNDMVYSGNNYFVLKDIDPSKIEYNNSFITYLNTIFDELNVKRDSYRGNFYSNQIINIIENPLNNYSSYSLFDGIWSGNRFIYTGDATVLDLFFDLNNIDYLGNEMPISGTIALDFVTISNIRNYITGFQLTNSGLYSGKPPTLSFSKYYYVEGISQNFQNLLFSSNCPENILINYSGNSSGIASGYLQARDVYISGIYGNGINKFKSIFGYNSYSNGDGYTGSPTVLWGTGGSCYSLPDVYGESGQFKRIHGAKANIKAHSDYTAGYPLTSGITGQGGLITGFVVTGITMTNLGSGYYNPILGRSYPQTIHFDRSEGDLLNNDASGYFNYIYEINPNNFSNIEVSYNFLDSDDYFLSSNIQTSKFIGFFIKPNNKKIINVRIKHNLDYVNVIRPTLFLEIQNNNYFFRFNKRINLGKTYNSDPNALI